MVSKSSSHHYYSLWRTKKHVLLDNKVQLLSPEVCSCRNGLFCLLCLPLASAGQDNPCGVVGWKLRGVSNRCSLVPPLWVWWAVMSWLSVRCHPATHSLPVLKRIGGENKVKKLMGWHKDRDIPYQLLSRAKRIWLQENSFLLTLL